MDNSANLIILPTADSVAFPGVAMRMKLTTPYARRLRDHVGIGEEFLVFKAYSPDVFADLKNIPLPALALRGTRCRVTDYQPLVVSGEIATYEVFFTGSAVVELEESAIDREIEMVRGVFHQAVDIERTDEEYGRFERDLKAGYNELRVKYPMLPVLRVPTDLPPAFRPFFYAVEFGLDLKTQQELLDASDGLSRYQKVIAAMRGLNVEPHIDREINQLTEESIQKGQREYVLRERAKAIKSLLKEFDGDDQDEKYEKLVEENPDLFPDYVRNRITLEAKRLKLLGQATQESSVARTYLDLLIKLPWRRSTVDTDDIAAVRRVLDEDHYGLEKQKQRILEYLAVKTLTGALKSPILCLYGPPGVGKTSLGISIARALDRKFVKFSLGGIYDESEIRGHRRTYVGALPGRIISGIANCGTNNPVFLLDEIDKVSGGGIHGDPAAALLELLDPEQNSNFEDHYLDLPFDLSNVMFICTANDLGGIPAPLRDRLELIELNTYTLFEKIAIAKRHLIGQELAVNGLKAEQIEFDDEALTFIIENYTREAGVRELRRKIGSVMRKFAVELLSGAAAAPFKVTPTVVENYLKKPIYFHTRPLEGQVGIVNGLAYTAYGGELLPIECNITKGKGELVKTGSLGDVMKESVSIAFSYVKALAGRYGYDNEYFSTHDFHVHVPEGAVPKDGPSAGVALSVCLLSAITGIPLRSDVAMTGEVDLRGNSMQIGGLREKTLAAVREHIAKVLIPANNHNDAAELPAEVRSALEIVEVKSVEDVVPHIFRVQPIPPRVRPAESK